MVSKRRRGPENAETRGALLDAAEAIIATDGVGAVTATRLAEAVGLKRQIVHYYFESPDELFAAMIRRNGERLLQDLEGGLASDEPLSAVLDKEGNPVGTVASFELIAFALRRPRLRAELSHFMDEFIKVQTQALERHFAQRGIQPKIPPTAASIVLSAASQALLTHLELDVATDQSEALDLVNRLARNYLAQGDFAVAVG